MQFRREHHKIIQSTQDRAREIALLLTQDDFFVVTADEQTKGRGTHGRHWLSPPGVNLYATFIFPFPRHHSDLLIHLPQVVAYAVLQTIRAFGMQAKLKWVNDILINKKKIGGILCETENRTQLRKNYAVLAGIGINVNMDKAFCNSLDQPATSLMLERGHSIEIEDILPILEDRILKNVGVLINEGFSALVADIAHAMEFTAQMIKVQLDDAAGTIKEGILLGLDQKGRLLLKIGDEIEKLTTGRILHPGLFIKI